jgi:phosphoribosylformimino-5-aminoimidazole carboxamide ribotide isomerase
VIVIPAIDLIGGKCVRLIQGVVDTAKIYHDHPEKTARYWQDCGAQILHVVNLDGAFGRAEKNVETVKRILKVIDIPIELGGGIRSLADAEKWLELGVGRIIYGTVALNSPEIVTESIAKFGAEKVIVGIDARNEKVAIKGWAEQTEKSMFDLAHEMKELSVKRIVFTDVAKDGELKGPNIETTVKLAQETGMNVIASGGFSQKEHFRQLAEKKCPFVEGVIVGKALYEGVLKLDEILKFLRTL